MIVKAAAFAILAAVLYALMTPVAKLLQISAGPVAEAGLLYLGAGAGMAVIYVIEKKLGIESGKASIGREDLKFVLAMIVLDMLAPIFLLLGLTMSTPESVSLLNNFEIVATTVLAVAFFREKVGGRLLASIILITISCMLLSLNGSAALQFSTGSLFVLLACICWGFENNCTSSLSEKDTRQIVMLKGFGSGSASLLLSFIIGEGTVSPVTAILIMILGFLAVGLSVYFYVLAQSRIGASRTSAYYAVAPFIGVLLSLIIFRQMPGKLFWAALLIMVVGVYISVKDTLAVDCEPQSNIAAEREAQ